MSLIEYLKIKNKAYLEPFSLALKERIKRGIILPFQYTMPEKLDRAVDFLGFMWDDFLKYGNNLSSDSKLQMQQEIIGAKMLQHFEKENDKLDYLRLYNPPKYYYKQITYGCSFVKKDAKKVLPIMKKLAKDPTNIDYTTTNMQNAEQIITRCLKRK